MVDVAERAGDVAGGVLALLLFDDQRDPLGFGVEAVGATEVEDVTGLVQHGGHDLCLAGQAQELAG